jgi:hypothetical protein
MYYKRYDYYEVLRALHMHLITPEQYEEIQSLIKNDTLKIKNERSLEIFSRFVPDYDVLSSSEPIEIKVRHWPHLKDMCLKFAHRDPCRWSYVTQDEEKELFFYTLEDYSVFCPSASSQNDLMDSSTHGID